MADVFINEARVMQMRANPAFTGEFPFLQTMTKEVKRGCRCSKQRVERIPDYAGIFAAIATMPNDRKAKLKQLLAANQVSVKYQLGGKVVLLKF